MIEVKSVRYDPREQVTVCAERYKELIEIEENSLQFYRLLKQLIIDRYVQNYACFGNGGTITYEELAELLRVKLPDVEHIGVTEYLKAKKEVKNG